MCERPLSVMAGHFLIRQETAGGQGALLQRCNASELRTLAESCQVAC